MEPKAIMFNEKVVVAVPDHVEDVMIIRKDASFNFTLPAERHQQFATGATIGNKPYKDPLAQ
mgnify:CR=1 FL=1|jgi:hypothetical protein